jgi:hypothetical protein
VRLSRRCPLISHEPDCVSFGEESDFVCTRVGFNSTSTICSCDRKASPSYTQRRLSANFSDGGSRDNVALQLYALNKEVFVQFEVTVLTADNLNVNSVSKSVIVLLMFGLVWGVGLIGMVISFFQRENQKKKLTEFQQNKIKAISRPRTEDLNRILVRYLDELFPVVFQSRSYIGRMIDEIWRHHRYLNLLKSHESAMDLRKVITFFHLLTVQTMLMFLLAVFYELQVSQSVPCFSL